MRSKGGATMLSYDFPNFQGDREDYGGGGGGGGGGPSSPQMHL